MSYVVFDKIQSNVVFTNVNVGIGTTIPRQLCHIEGNEYIAGNLGIGTTNPSMG